MTSASRDKQSTAAALDAGREPPIDASAPSDAVLEVTSVLAYANGYRKGRRDALAQSKEEAAREREEIEREKLVFRNWRIRVYAESKYPTLSVRALSEAIASDLLVPRIRRELDAPSLTAHAIRKILSGYSPSR
jgi:hypothetical protein